MGAARRRRRSAKQVKGADGGSRWEALWEKGRGRRRSGEAGTGRRCRSERQVGGKTRKGGKWLQISKAGRHAFPSAW